MLPVTLKITNRFLAIAKPFIYNPERITTEFRVTDTGEPSSEAQATGLFTTVTYAKRLVAVEGNNGKYSIQTFCASGDHDSDMAAKSAHTAFETVRKSLFGYPDGDLTRDEAIAALKQFEDTYPQKTDPQLSGKIPHVTILNTEQHNL